MLINDDALSALKKLEACSIDALVTDPPAGIGFMNKSWDKDKGGRNVWVVWLADIMAEVYRVLKPGAHGLVWALPRTSHWTATALEDAGFEIRDIVTHVFGTGFPKSLDISKAIDKSLGIEGPVIGKNPAFRERQLEHDAKWQTAMRPEHKHGPGSEDAKQWSGFGTALKPASENWILIRKPLSEKNVAANVLKHGTGGINIDGCRIDGVPRNPGFVSPSESNRDMMATSNTKLVGYQSPSGRFPANLVLSHNEDCDTECTEGCAVAELDRQSGILKSGAFTEGTIQKATEPKAKGAESQRVRGARASDIGGASRFFYCAKASKADRGADNKHPTVKSTKLMAYLLRLVTPPNGTVLDPFMGSGSTGVAAISEGFSFIGIELEKEYFEIAQKRLACQMA